MTGRSVADGAARSARSLAAEAAFRARLVELGAELLEPTWLGAQVAHKVRCRAGHSCKPRPADVRKGHGVCGLCVGNSRGSGHLLFRERLAKIGATLIEPVWLGSGVPHRAICANGHMCRPTPANVSQGHGVCLRCRQLSWTAFYVLTHDSDARVKFGITSPPIRRRIREHARAGYTTAVRLVTDLPGTLAEDTERAVRAALALAGVKPLKGREYFDVSCLGLILDVADSWLARGADAEDYVADSNGQLLLFAA